MTRHWNLCFESVGLSVPRTKGPQGLLGFYFTSSISHFPPYPKLKILVLRNTNIIAFIICFIPLTPTQFIICLNPCITCNSFKIKVPILPSKIRLLGFPGGAVVENLPANSGDMGLSPGLGRDMGSSPGLGRSHMPRSNQAREPQLLSLRVWSLCSATGEATIVRGPRTAMKSGPHLPQLEKALAQKRRPNTAINKLKKKKYDYC